MRGTADDRDWDGPHVSFPTTRWTLVGRAGEAAADDDARRAAVGGLLQLYLPALRSFLRSRVRGDVHRAEDLLQGFLADRVVESGLLARADRGRGRFRSFIAIALDHYAVDRCRREAAAKRSPGGRSPASLDALSPDARHAAAAGGDPSAAFDRAWAARVLRLSVDRMRSDCRPDVWAVFDGRVLRPTLEGLDPVPLADLVRSLGVTAAQASNLLGTARRTFARALRSVVAEYADGDEVEAELRAVRAILAGSPGGPAR